MDLRRELVRVSNEIKNGSRQSVPVSTMSRVSPHIRELKKELYDCQLLSFGLYNREIQAVCKEDLKVEVVAAFLVDVNKEWDRVCKLVADPLAEGQALSKLYEDYSPTETPSHVRDALTLDAVFLTIFMSYWKNSEGPRIGDRLPRTWKVLGRAKLRSNLEVMFSDIWLFENQIPLGLIKNVWCEVLGEKEETFYPYVRRTVFSAIQYYTLPYDEPLEDTPEPLSDIPYHACVHMLACLYESVCFTKSSIRSKAPKKHNKWQWWQGDGDLEMGPTSGKGASPPATVNKAAPARDEHPKTTLLGSDQTPSAANNMSANNPTGLRGLYTGIRSWVMGEETTENTRRRKTHSRLVSATERLKAGIKVRGTRTSFHDITFVTPFHKLSATLHIPRINVADNTDRILRNLCAFERIHGYDEDTPRSHPIMNYVSMMDHLVDTMDDVRLLREGKQPVIALNFLGSEKDVADLFNNILRNYHFSSSRELEETYKEVHDWYSWGIRHKLTLFIAEFNVRPWKAAAVFLLILACLQTVYTIVGFYKSS